MKVRLVPALLFFLVACALSSQDKLPRKGFFGIQSAPITAETRTARNLPATGGVLIATVVPGSTAEVGGIKAQDVLLELNGKPVIAMNHVGEFVSATMPGT